MVNVKIKTKFEKGQNIRLNISNKLLPSFCIVHLGNHTFVREVIKCSVAIFICKNCRNSKSFLLI